MSTNRMFRLSDPLGNYSSDPRHGQGVRSPVVAYQPVQETSKPSSSKFWLTVSLLVILISSLFFLVVLRRQKDGDISEPIDDIPRGECIECIDFDKVSNVLTDSKNVEKYLQEKLSNITRINIATGDSNRSLEGYKDKHGQVGSLQDKVSQLVSLKEKFEKAVKEAAVIENRLKTMKGEYDNKLNKIEEFGNKSLNTVRQVDIQKKNIKDWENDLNGVHGTLTVTDKGLKEKKIEFYDKLTKINKQIEGELSRAGFTEDQLEAFLERKQNGIRQIKGEKYDCEESNKKKQEDIGELKRQNQTLSKELFRIEYEKKSKRMQIHSLKTAQKLEKLLEELYNLQKSSAEEAKQYFDDIVQSIESKIREYEEITSGKGGQNDDYKTKAAEDLQHAIKQEKKLLEEWMGEQIKSLRVSNEEIKNMTSYLEETNNQITGGRKELEELLASEERVRAELKRIPSQIEELLRGINDCNLVIERSKKQVEKEKEEVDKVSDLQSRIAKLRSEMKEEQKKFVNQEEGSSGSRNTLALEEQSLEEDIKKARRDIESAEYNVKHFATEINELLKKEPANEDVKREEKRYQDKMNIVIDTNTQIETLVKEIKKLL